MVNGDDYFSWYDEDKIFIHFDLTLYSQKFVLRNFQYLNPSKKKLTVAQNQNKLNAKKANALINYGASTEWHIM